ncbi:MAG: ribosomal protein S18-alanine N-acetyltransferase [bacterium]
MSDVRVRPMRWWDIAPAARIDRDRFGDTAWTEAQFWGELAQPTRYYVVAEDPGDVDAEIVGYAGLWVMPPDSDVQTLAVAAGREGSGLGSLLLRRLLEEAGDRGCTRTILEVRDDNARALDLYSRHGFATISRRTSYYGPGLDAVIMCRAAGSGA